MFLPFLYHKYIISLTKISIMERLKKYVSTDEFVDELHSNKLPSVIRIENDLLGFKNLNDDRYKFYEYNKTKNKLQLKISFSLWWKVEDNILYIRNDKQEGYQEKLLYVDKDKSLNNGWHLLDNKSEITKCVIENEVHPMSLCAAFNEFSGITAIEGVENIKTDKCKSLRGLTNKCTSLSSIDLSNWDVSNVTNMKIMFQLCSTLTSVGDLSNWDTSNVADTGWMFYGCSSLASVDLSNWDTSNVTNLKSMFNGCSKLTSVGDLSNWDTSNVTDTSYMFYKCSKLTSVGDLSNWDTSNVTDTGWMFYGCSSLASVDLSNWNMSNVTNLKSMFCNCSKLTSVGDLSNWDTSNVTDMSYMFLSNKNLEDIDISKWDMSKVTTTDGLFNEAYKLKHISLPDNLRVLGTIDDKNFGYGCFNHASGYEDETFTLPKSMQYISYIMSFYNFGKDNVFKRFIIDQSNQYFTTDEYGILYSKDMTRLVAVPRAVDIGDTDTFTIPENVTTMGELSFSREHTFTKLVIPDNYVIVRNTSYSGLNTGNSLAIAIYKFTTIDTYIVNDTNPNYMSYNGCIYSKDGTELIAVPTRYDGDLVIKDGCTTIGEEAFWSDDAGEEGNVYTTYESEARGKYIKTIYIPASVTNIESNQIATLNGMFNGYTSTNSYKGVNAVDITIDENNPKYMVSTDASGKKSIVEK
jgi:surface protein